MAFWGSRSASFFILDKPNRCAPSRLSTFQRVLRPAEAVARAVESFPSIYDTEVLLLVLLLHASTRSQRQGRRAVWFPKKWLSKNAGRTLRRKLFASQNPGIKSRPPGLVVDRGRGWLRDKIALSMPTVGNLLKGYVAYLGSKSMQTGSTGS